MCEFINTFLKPVIYLTCQLFLTLKISFCFNTKTLYFSGCKLLYKQDFARRLGLRCVTCNYCSQLCKKGATRELDGVVRDFCSEECCRRFQDWYYKASTPAGLTPEGGRLHNTMAKFLLWGCGEVVSDMGGKSRAVLEDSLGAVVPAAFGSLYPSWAKHGPAGR